MINYLNSTKRLFVALTTTTALAGSLSLVSCQDYDAIDEEKFQAALTEKQFEATLDEYTKNFEARYGKIDPNHTWGFGPIVGDPSAVTRAQVANKNEWVEVYHMQVPGQPDIWTDKDGVQHKGYDNKPYHNISGDDNIWSAEPGNEPAGDVTNEEIAYVSWWFRTHRYPSSLNVHWSDFYIQEVSADNDRDANGNIVNDYTAAEFVKRTDGSWDNVRYECVSEYGINQLKVKVYDNAFGGDTEGYDHIYNFNSGHANKLSGISNLSTQIQTNGNYGWEDLDNPYFQPNKRLIAYYQSSGTEDWAAHYSQDQVWRHNYEDGVNNKPIWVMVHLHFIGKSGRVYDGYYLGFDYAFHKVESDENGAKKYQIRKPDGYYSNWIVKVSPGVPIVPDNPSLSFTQRIMCEDLGNTNDLDFDDVVFDVTLNIKQETLNAYNDAVTPIPTEGIDATVTLMAAGGTMPIWVGNNPNLSLSAPYEAHDLFNQDRTTPVNVEKGANAPIVNYHIRVHSTNLDEVGIWVYNTLTEGNKGWVELPKSVHDFKYQGPTGYLPVSGKNYAPQKFAVPPTVLWLKETHQIEQGYPHFGDWVNQQDGQYSISGQTPWYATGIVQSHLCGMIAETPSSTTPTPGSVDDSGLVGTTSTYASVNTYDVIPFVNHKEWGELEVQGGTYNKYTDGYSFNAGATATLVAKPKGNCTFKGWVCSGFQGQNPIVINDNKIVVDGMKYVVAYFENPDVSAYSVTYPSDVQIISHKNKDSQDATTFNYQDRITFKYVGTDKIVKDWKLNDQLQYTNGSQTFELILTDQQNTNYAVDVIAVDKCELRVALLVYDENGNQVTNTDLLSSFSVWCNNTGEAHHNGDIITCYEGQTFNDVNASCDPNTGYHLDSFTFGSEELSVSQPNTITYALGKTLTAVFRNTYTLGLGVETYAVDGETKLDVSGGTLEVSIDNNDFSSNSLTTKSNTTVNYRAIPISEDYEIMGWGDGQSHSDTGSFNLNANMSLIVKFKKRS